MKLLKSKAGFTLIELLVVIGILAVLAAIAIPSVAGLIDRANVSADATNANEMTNAIERFTSEYELYCQDIASGVIKDADSNGVPDDMDGAQGRVFNVTKAMTRANITALESAGLGDRQINRDTKYPTNLETLKAVVENYTKTSSATFEPKQSDCSFYYSPDCGVVVCAPTDATVAQLNALILSGKDAKGNTLTDSTVWSNVTTEAALSEGSGEVLTFAVDGITYQFRNGMTWGEWVSGEYNTSYTRVCGDCGTGYKSILNTNGSITMGNEGCDTCFEATKCAECDGSGHYFADDPDGGSWETCPDCGGVGAETEKLWAIVDLVYFESQEDYNNWDEESENPGVRATDKINPNYVYVSGH